MGGAGSEGKSTSDHIKLWETDDRAGILLTLDDTKGALAEALNLLANRNINITSIKSKPPKTMNDKKMINIHIDFYGTF